MALDSKYRNCGLLKVKPGVGVLVYFTPNNYDYLYCQDIATASWTPDGCIIVMLKNGRYRLYKDLQTYDWL